MWEYTDKVHEHFLNPKNVGEIKDANAIGEVGSLACGDALKLYLKIDNNKIVDAKFQTFGCASAIASSSVLTEMVKGLTVEEAEKITNQDIANKLGGLPKEKMHCSVMGQEALELAIRKWRGVPDQVTEDNSNLICKCFAVTEKQIIKAIKNNQLTSLAEITNFTKAGGACGECLGKIKIILDKVVNKNNLTEIKLIPKEKPAAVLSNLERMQKVMAVIENSIRPLLQKDGGDIELKEIDGRTVYVQLKGMCSNCPSSQATLKKLVEATLQTEVDPAITVKESV